MGWFSGLVSRLRPNSQSNSQAWWLPRPLVLPAPSGVVDIMSIYQPFPLRIEGQQYDACFQIGEFSSVGMSGSGVVVLIPLVVGSDPTGSGAKFINAFASKMSAVTVVDKETGYQDTPVTGLTSWKVGDILKTDRPFYTWITKEGTRVVVMAEPIKIAEGDMASIQLTLPITPPGDAIHEITNVKYKSSPPDCVAHPELCKKPFKAKQPAITQTTGGANKDTIVKVILSIISALALFIAVKFAIDLANGSGASFVNSASTGLASVFDSIWKGLGRARQGLSSAASSATASVQQLQDRPVTMDAIIAERKANAAAKRKANADKAADTFDIQNNPLRSQPRPSPEEQANAAGTGLIKPATVPPAKRQDLSQTAKFLLKQKGKIVKGGRRRRKTGRRV